MRNLIFPLMLNRNIIFITTLPGPGDEKGVPHAI